MVLHIVVANEAEVWTLRRARARRVVVVLRVRLRAGDSIIQMTRRKTCLWTVYKSTRIRDVVVAGWVRNGKLQELSTRSEGMVDG